MENTTYTNKNPCIGCQDSWFAEGDVSCHDFCEDYQLYLDRQKLINYNNKIKLKIDAEISETFKQNLDEWRNEFINKEASSSYDIIMTYKIFEFIKSKY